jgi:hypothetical protein
MNAAIAIKSRAEHRLGEVLALTVRAGKPNCNTPLQLPAEIDRMQSSRAQTLARMTCLGGGSLDSPRESCLYLPFAFAGGSNSPTRRAAPDFYFRNSGFLFMRPANFLLTQAGQRRRLAT